MCCFLLSILLLGPRVGLAIFWLIPYGNAKIDLAFNTTIVPILGVIFAPWTTLMWAFFAPNGVAGFEWVLIIAAVFADIGTYGGGVFKRKEIPFYPSTPTPPSSPSGV